MRPPFRYQHVQFDAATATFPMLAATSNAAPQRDASSGSAAA